MTIPIISFFTGGGFLDMGFERCGFKVCWTNEANRIFADMYETAIAGWRAAELGVAGTAKVTDYSRIETLSAEKVLQAAFCAAPPVQFGIIGGPPCTDFSIGGLHGGSTGEHGRLTDTFIGLICTIRPQFFVIENVPGLSGTRKHRLFLSGELDRLEEHGYAVDCTVLNALEYGVPQNRHRLFIVGIEQHIAEERLGRGLLRGSRSWFPWPKDPRYEGAGSLPWPATNAFGAEPELPAGIPVELTVHYCLTHPVDAELAPNGNEAFVPYSDRFKEIAEGDVKGKSFKRLHRYRYSPTAWYGHNEVHLHPWKPRRLSVREALRIQTVPDSYVLPSEVALQPKFKLICNGVPCRLAESVASAIRGFLASGVADGV